METVERHVTLPASVEEVWELITRPEELGTWLGDERYSGERQLHPGLGAVILAHLSVHCNSAGMAMQMPEKVLDRLAFKGTLQVAPQDRPLEPIDVTALRRKHVRAEQLSLL